jgi:hypothetical protein
MNAKNIVLKILNIIFALAILIAFFLPWADGGSFGTLSAFETIKYSVKLGLFDHINQDNMIYPIGVISLLIFPLCSMSIILVESLSFRSLRMFVPQILMLLTFIAYIVFIASKYEEKGFELLGYGGYITAFSVLLLFVRIFIPNPKKVKINK